MFQRLHHLNVTGDLDTQTVSKMSSPRCGFPDIPIDNLAPRVSAFKACNIKKESKKNLKNLIYKLLKIKLNGIKLT